MLVTIMASPKTKLGTFKPARAIMAAVVAAPAPLSADDARALLQPPPVDYTQIYASLTPRDSLPLLAVSGVTGKAFWIGSLPQPPDEEEETDDEETGEESEEEHEHETDAAAIKVRVICILTHEMAKAIERGDTRETLSSADLTFVRHRRAEVFIAMNGFFTHTLRARVSLRIVSHPASQ